MEEARVEEAWVAAVWGGVALAGGVRVAVLGVAATAVEVKEAEKEATAETVRGSVEEGEPAVEATGL